ncbi:MAG: ABC transporter permease [Hyphomicrobiaceae bacterium]
MNVDVATLQPAAPPSSHRFRRLIGFAVLELRGGLHGFYVFVACVALGVAVITAVGALTDALRAGFERQGENLLGGDVTLSRPHRRAEPPERTWMESRGRVSETATLRAMARRTDASEQVMVELKGVDKAYPLVGSLTLGNGTSVDTALQQGPGVAVDPILLERLGLKIGDRMQLGNATVEIRATVAAEPDKLTDRLTFGPRVFVSLDTLPDTGLAGPGSLVRWRYALTLSGNGHENEGLIKFRDAVKAQLPDGGFTVADRRDPHPQVTRTLERLRQFLTLIGLTALLVGGVGVANAVATFIDRRRKIIATFKSLGATSATIFTLHLVQVLLIAGIGVAIGLVAGLLLPFAMSFALADALPIQAEISVRPASLLVATAYGFLVALLFALWPLGRAELVRAAVLFREEVAPEGRVWPRPRIIVATVAVAAALLVLALATSESKRIALYFCLSVAGIFAVFIALGIGITALARSLPRPRNTELALALGSIGAPGGLTRSVILSLGAGLSLLVAVALANASIVSELSSRLPQNSPDYFVLDIPSAELAPLVDLVQRETPAAQINSAPMLRGRLIRLNDTPVDQIKAAPESSWVLTGDRGLTFADDVPEGSTVTKGTWWPADYAGEPLVSFEAELARGLDLRVGDTVTVNVLGRNLTARIANLREVKWESLAINFVMVFSPNALHGAPHNLLATISLPADVPLATEAALARSIGKAHPAVTTLRVKDAINAFNSVYSRIMTAVRVAGGVTLAAGALVLAGALATAQRRRIQQAVILKALGATRARILRSHLFEYALLAAVTALLAIVLGGLVAWIAVTQVMDLPFAFSWTAVAQALGVALTLVAVLGGIGTSRVLRAPAVPYLRAE